MALQEFKHVVQSRWPAGEGTSVGYAAFLAKLFTDADHNHDVRPHLPPPSCPLKCSQP